MTCPTCASDTRVLETRRLNAKQYRLRRCNGGHEVVTLEVSTSMTARNFRRLDHLNRKERIA